MSNNDNYVYGPYGVDRDKQNHFVGTVWSSKPFEGTAWQNEATNSSYSNDTRESLRDRQSSGNSSVRIAGSSNNNGGRLILSILAAMGFVAVTTSAQSALAATISQSFVGQDWETTRHFLMQWLGLAGNVFIHISTLTVIVTSFMALSRNFFGYMAKGAMVVAVTGLLVFFGTFLYLVGSGIFFGK